MPYPISALLEKYLKSKTNLRVMRQRKFAKKKAPKDVLLAICEGETERTYVEMLKVRYRIPITIKTRVSGTKISKRLLQQYLNELRLQDGDGCRVYFIYDADVEHIVDKLEKLQGKLILTNPCIELWFLLHAREYSKSSGSQEIVRELQRSNPVWSGYIKGDLNSRQCDFLISNVSKASERSRKSEMYRNPSSNMHSFIEDLENYKSFFRSVNIP